MALTIRLTGDQESTLKEIMAQEGCKTASGAIAAMIETFFTRQEIIRSTKIKLAKVSQEFYEMRMSVLRMADAEKEYIQQKEEMLKIARDR